MALVTLLLVVVVMLAVVVILGSIVIFFPSDMMSLLVLLWTRERSMFWFITSFWSSNYSIEEKVIKVIKEEFDCRFKSVITSDVQVKQRPSGNNKKRKQLTKNSSAEHKNKKQKKAKVAEPIPTSALVPEQPIHPRLSQTLLPASPITPSPKPSKKKNTHQEVHLQGYLQNIRGRERCK